MLFNSIEFAIFLPVVFILYWFVANKNIRVQNLFIVLASYVFYGWWDLRFLTLILVSTLIDYGVGIGLKQTQNQIGRKFLLGLSITANLGLLCFFKYYDFFIESFAEGFRLLGYSLSVSSLNLVLPVGISFYTFQTMSYSIDVYRNKLEPAHDIISFIAFVSFFPQLVAGPIERATHLLPQFYKTRKFDSAAASEGMRQILWGLFKKIVIADQCADSVNLIFGHDEILSGSTILIGAVLFAFQIYGDFSGYSDIAIGTSRLFGFTLMQNFNYPYFSRDIAEFWRRWHISLSTWFRDYLYIPLGGSKSGQLITIRNTIIVFIVSGFWHGASWNFILWGALHALFYLPLLVLQKNRNHLSIVAQNRMLPSFQDSISILFTFSLTTLAWIFFRADSVPLALQYISRIFSHSILSFPELIQLNKLLILLLLISLFNVVEWKGRKALFALSLENLPDNRYWRYSIYLFLAIVIFIFQGKPEEFIYFQF